MDISMLNIIIESGNWYLHFKNLFDLKIDIWILNYSFRI
jgi:hypothetical protein